MAARALVTGASGFAGGYLVEHLLARGDAVLACDVAGNGPGGMAGASASHVEWIPWDLADPAGLDAEGQRRVEQFRPTIIYHLAALSIPADCGADKPTAEALAVNVEGTRRVVELAASLASRPRVLITSSSHVYGPVPFDSPVVTEDFLTNPAGGYGKTKLAAEQIASEIARPAGIDLIIARAFQHAGPRQNRRMMLAEWAGQLAEPSDQPIKVHTLDAWVDLSDVRDVVRAYRLLATLAYPGVYNVGSGVSRRSGDLVQILLRAAGSRRAVVEFRPGAKQDPIADVSRLVEGAGWRPEIPIEQTVADTLAYWRTMLGPKNSP